VQVTKFRQDLRKRSQIAELARSSDRRPSESIAIKTVKYLTRTSPCLSQHLALHSLHLLCRKHICLTIVSAGQELQDSYEIRPDTQKATHNNEDPSQNARTGVDYEPHPEKSLKVSPEHERIVKCIPRLYSESANDEDMRVYAENAVYDDPWSYCNRRYKIAGQWYGT